jgi:membrane-bound lytic murein transglycosylase D
MFHNRPTEIAAANDLQASALIDTGDELVIPVSAAFAVPHPVYYITRVGDTLVTIADRFNVSVEDLRRWNHLSSSTIKPHRTLDVAQPVHLAPATHVRAKRSHAASTATSKSTATRSSKSSAKASPHGVTPKKKTSAK